VDSEKILEIVLTKTLILTELWMYES